MVDWKKLLIGMMIFLLFSSMHEGSAETVWNEFERKQNVPLHKEWTVTFNKEVEASSVNKGSIYVLDSSGKNIPVSLRREGNKVIVEPPEEGYRLNTTYSLYISEEVYGKNKKPLKNPVKMDFTTDQNYKIVGYYAGWSTYSGFHVSDIDAEKLTHLNYAFANITEDGKISVGDPWADVEKTFPGDERNQPYKGNFYQLNKLKEQYPHIKTLISVGGWSWSENFSDVALTDQSRTVFADSVLQFILNYGFDGVDLDWEYPVGGGEADNVNRPEDKQNFTLLLKKIRETFGAQSAKDGKEYLLTVAGGAGLGYVKNVELNAIQQYVDYVQLMTYDLHGPWDTLTGHNAPLYRDPYSGFRYDWSVQDAVETYIRHGVAENKIVMGIPFYGNRYHHVNHKNNGLYQTFNGGSTVSYKALKENYLNKNGFIRYWGSQSKVPWLFNGSQWISYDDEESIRYKTDFIKSMDLGGAMIWALGQDYNGVLLSEIHHGLQSK